MARLRIGRVPREASRPKTRSQCRRLRPAAITLCAARRGEPARGKWSTPPLRATITALPLPRPARRPLRDQGHRPRHRISPVELEQAARCPLGRAALQRAARRRVDTLARGPERRRGDVRGCDAPRGHAPPGEGVACQQGGGRARGLEPPIPRGERPRRLPPPPKGARTYDPPLSSRPRSRPPAASRRTPGARPRGSPARPPTPTAP